MSDRFDFEEQITRCWCIVDELKDLDEGLFEGWLKFDKDNVSTHILGISQAYDVKFHKLWHLFETVYMDTIRENKMLNEECSALREQLVAETQGYNLGKKPVYDDEFRPFYPKVLQDNEKPSPAVIKANKKVKK